ncbi:MAG: four helix bundle protein [Planctomycetes bacterium]|nr:four helix bundle protein [Planctomycetota bacterium]
MQNNDLKDRTKKFALRVMRLVSSLPKNSVATTIGNQLIRSGTSVAANYRAACRGRSRAEFNAKLGICLEEADETALWIELLIEGEIVTEKKLSKLLVETNELVSIFVASLKTSLRNKAEKVKK